MEQIISDLMATNLYERVPQELNYRLHDTYVEQVPRFRHKNAEHPLHYYCLNFWSESVHMLAVDDALVEVPDWTPLNATLMESYFDPVAPDVVSIDYEKMLANGVKMSLKTSPQSLKTKQAMFVPQIPHLIDSYLDQHRYCMRQSENFKYSHTYISLAGYHITNFIRYLHLEKPYQRAKLIPLLEDRNQADMNTMLDKYKRKPLFKGFR